MPTPATPALPTALALEPDPPTNLIGVAADMLERLWRAEARGQATTIELLSIANQLWPGIEASDLLPIARAAKAQLTSRL